MTYRIGRLGRISTCWSMPRSTHARLEIAGWTRAHAAASLSDPGETGSGAVLCTVRPSADAHASPRSRTRAPRSWTLPLGVEGEDDVSGLGECLRGIPDNCSSACTTPLVITTPGPLRRPVRVAHTCPRERHPVACGDEHRLDEAVATRAPVVQADVTGAARCSGSRRGCGEEPLRIGRLRCRRLEASYVPTVAGSAWCGMFASACRALVSWRM